MVEPSENYIRALPLVYTAIKGAHDAGSNAAGRLKKR